MQRIFFDTNTVSNDGGYLLCLDRSIADLVRLKNELRDGIEVQIYMPDELEMRALLYFSSKEGYWRAEVIEGSLVHFCEHISQ